ncbi:hypothetical protein ACHAQA_005731 [Verticillium albo-atrum]
MDLRRAHDGANVIFGDRSGMSYYDVKAEYNNDKVTCLVRIAVGHAQGTLTLAKYLDGILAHLKQGGVHHKFDSKVPDHGSVETLGPFFILDLLVGAVRGLMWSERFKPLEDKEWKTLRALAAIAWETDEPEDFQRESSKQSANLPDLSPEAADLLLIICYSRRHLKLFTYLLTMIPTPAQSSFDRFGGSVIESRTLHLSSVHQHSEHVAENVELEVRFWTMLLNSGWIHDPLESSLERDIESLSVMLCTEGISRGISSGDLTVAIAESLHLKGSTRAEVMRLVLERFKGLDVDAAIYRPWASDMRDFGRPDEHNDECNALQAAAWQGDKELAKVLVEYGAKVTVVDRISGQDARGFARKQGHKALARWLDKVAREEEE